MADIYGTTYIGAARKWHTAGSHITKLRPRLLFLCLGIIYCARSSQHQLHPFMGKFLRIIGDNLAVYCIDKVEQLDQLFSYGTGRRQTFLQNLVINIIDD